MPPIPLDFSELPVIKNPRMKLYFGNPVLCEQHEQVAPMKQHSHLYESQDRAEKSKFFGKGKRSLESLDTTPSSKRRRSQFYTATPTTEDVTVRTTQTSNIFDAVEKMTTEPSLVADGSRENILPTIPGKHRDLSAISPKTMSDVLDGVYDDKIEKVTIIDCRYPYEYNGGHIKGAINLYTKETIQEFLQESVTSTTINHALIFHCEFSSERGPKMYRFLRSLDRDLNKDNYPRLNFPEIYLLEGGYKAFFYSCKDKCYPQTYRPMLHKEHKDDLRHFRVKSKSWSAGDKPDKSCRSSLLGMAQRLRF